MSMSGTGADEVDDGVLAAEFVLGVLDGAERLALDARRELRGRA